MSGYRMQLSLLLLLLAWDQALGHGRMTVPRARNGGDNGAVGGGPGDVHEFDTDGHAKYQHGTCGNAAGGPQTYNRAGEIQAEYTAGQVAEFKVVITAHHVGFFEFELCASSADLSEECFAQHRLLKEGCECTCGDDPDCQACYDCRRWWKPLVQGELGQTVAEGYAGPQLPGAGNLKPYEFTMHFVIPEGLQSSSAVLRWHYMTTNSCTSKSSSPEEFWNCADVAIKDASGDVGGSISPDNVRLEGMVVEDLIPLIDSGVLAGVFAHCPEDADGNLLGVAPAAEYEGLCGEATGADFVNCRDATGAGRSSDCINPPDSGIVCEAECSDTWYSCAGGIAYTKAVPAGTKCKGDAFVLEATCVGYMPGQEEEEEEDPTPAEEPEPSTTEAPATTTVASSRSTVQTTEAPTKPPPSTTTAVTAAPATTTMMTTVQASTATVTLTTTVPETAASATSTTRADSPTTTPEPTTIPSAPSGCESCRGGCLWSHGQCFMGVTEDYCNSWSNNTWCPVAFEQSSAAVATGAGHRHSMPRGAHGRQERFLGLMQEGVRASRTLPVGTQVQEDSRERQEEL